MGYNYRCSDRRNCGTRKTLKHLIDWYRTRPLCPGCKRDTLKPTYRKEYLRGLRRMCRCRGNGWVHVKGKIIDEHRTCLHAAVEDVEAAELGFKSYTVKETDDCPF